MSLSLRPLSVTPDFSLFSPSRIYQELRNRITIPMSNNLGFIGLGPMGNPNPMDLINLETNRIPFKLATMDLEEWDGAFRSWPSHTPGWRDWFLKMSASKKTLWDEQKIYQCITLSLSSMERNESMLVAASYFWSDALNAFLFGHGRCPLL